MTRKADPEIVKLKRKVIKLHSDFNTVGGKLSLFIGYPYSPSEWESIKAELDEEMLDVHETTERRYQAANNIVVLKAKKRQLRKLSSSSSLSKSQIAAFSNVKNEVSEAIGVLSNLPDLGISQGEWDNLPEDLKSKNVGHPKVTLEEHYLTIRSEMNLVHKQVNDLEEIGEKSTIEDILEEEKIIAVNAGRKKLPDSVANIEELERKKRALITQIEDIQNESEVQEVKKGRGKRKLSKAERLSKKTSLLSDLNTEISHMDSLLGDKDYALRHKRVLEREKRYAKQERRTTDMKKIESKLNLILNVIDRIDDGKLSGDKAKSVVDKAVSSVDITIEAAVQDIIDDALSSSNEVIESESVDEGEKSISEIFESIDLPRF